MSKGGLRIPSSSFQEAINQLELVFKESNGCKNIYRGKDFVNYHINLSDHVDLSIPVKQVFFRVRLFARIRLLNELRKEAKIEQALQRKQAKKARLRTKRLKKKVTKSRGYGALRKSKKFRKMKKTKSYCSVVLFSKLPYFLTQSNSHPYPGGLHSTIIYSGYLLTMSFIAISAHVAVLWECVLHGTSNKNWMQFICRYLLIYYGVMIEIQNNFYTILGGF